MLPLQESPKINTRSGLTPRATKRDGMLVTPSKLPFWKKEIGRNEVGNKEIARKQVGTRSETKMWLENSKDPHHVPPAIEATITKGKPVIAYHGQVNYHAPVHYSTMVNYYAPVHYHIPSTSPSQPTPTRTLSGSPLQATSAPTNKGRGVESFGNGHELGADEMVPSAGTPGTGHERGGYETVLSEMVSDRHPPTSINLGQALGIIHELKARLDFSDARYERMNRFVQGLYPTTTTNNESETGPVGTSRATATKVQERISKLEDEVRVWTSQAEADRKERARLISVIERLQYKVPGERD